VGKPPVASRPFKTLACSTRRRQGKGGPWPAPCRRRQMIGIPARGRPSSRGGGPISRSMSGRLAAGRYQQIRAGQRGDEPRAMPRVPAGWPLQQRPQGLPPAEASKFGLQASCSEAGSAGRCRFRRCRAPTATAARVGKWRRLLWPSPSASPCQNSSRSPKGFGQFGSGVLAPGFGGMRGHGWASHQQPGPLACCAGCPASAESGAPQGLARQA